MLSPVGLAVTSLLGWQQDRRPGSCVPGQVKSVTLLLHVSRVPDFSGSLLQGDTQGKNPSSQASDSVSWL